ncbi:Twisted gastrulation 1-B [Portunus trituberculatus]|uniref:Twisted gastrulation 1-B n=1 Tax=Portunus trituberculatus TaxID=210409 RepID=A0A5B7K851_PORTR|nr:Twisted gastrulation 1-B [Portunus trituberculatus]
MRWEASTWVMVVVMACLGAWTCHACNEVVCASMVSKCMLTQACKCDLTRSPDNNCTCCRDCAKCLGYLYTECCSCLGMCEARAQVLDRTDSQVGDLPEPFPHMFKALTGEKDMLLRWTSITFPIDVDLTDIDATTMNKNRYKLGEWEVGFCLFRATDTHCLDADLQGTIFSNTSAPDLHYIRKALIEVIRVFKGAL